MQSVVNRNFCFFSPELAIKNILVSKMNGTRLWFPFIALLVIQMKQKLQNGLDLVIYLLHLPGSVKQNVQVNLCQKFLFLHQLTHNMTIDCSLNYKFKPGENLLCTEIVSDIPNNFCTQHVLPRFKLGIFMYWTNN